MRSIALGYESLDYKRRSIVTAPHTHSSRLAAASGFILAGKQEQLPTSRCHQQPNNDNFWQWDESIRTGIRYVFSCKAL
jgi:hypothetical protein